PTWGRTGSPPFGSRSSWVTSRIFRASWPPSAGSRACSRRTASSRGRRAAMRVVVQRVSRASVRARGITVAEIGPGLLVLCGVGMDDSPGEAGYLARKVHELRIFEDDGGKMNRSLAEVRGEVLVVPQFTLYADTSRGRRPSWIHAAPPEVAKERVETF